MSYLFTFIISILLVFIIAVPLNSFADQQPVINEFVAHPSSGNKEWVELYVPDGKDLMGYWIDDDTDFTDDSGSSAKKQITSLLQGSDANHIVFELSSSMFNNDGDTIALFAPDGTLLDRYIYIKDPGVDMSIGRTPDGNGDFKVLATATKGNPNSSPQPTDTPIPVPTDKPTKTPKPTETPKPLKSANAVVVPTTIKGSTLSNNMVADSTTNTSFNNASISTTKPASNGAYPTAILGASTKSAVPKVSYHPTGRVLVKGISDSLPQLIAVIIGGLMFVGCGILLYFKKRRIWFWRSD